MKHSKLLLIITLCAIFMIAGCANKEVRTSLEDIGLVGIMGLDYVDEANVNLSVAIPQYSPNAQEDTEVFTVSTDLIAKGVIDIEALSDKKILFNQLRVILINEEYAQKGKVQKMMEFLYRNPESGDKVLIAVVKGTVKELLNANYPSKPNINFYLNDLLEPTINTAFNPNTNIHDYIYSATNPVLDPIVPIIEKKGDKIDISGVALFKSDHMLEILSPDDALYIQYLQEKKKLAPLPLELHQGHGTEKLMLDLVKSNVHIKSNKNFKSPKLTITLNIKGSLVEYKGERYDTLNNLESLSQLETDISKQLKEEMIHFLNKLQEQKVDPIGLSENFRMYYKGKWTKEMTEETISKLEIELKVHTIIISSGNLN